MKIRQKWLVAGLILVTVGFMFASVCIAQDEAADNDRQSQHSRGRQMMPGGRGMGRGMEPVGGPGRGQRPGGGMRSGGGRWRSMVDKDELLLFLNEHESRLAARLKELQKTSPEEYGEQLSTLSRLYGPVIRQMEMNPEMGQLSLNKIRLSLRIKELVQEAKKEGAGLPKIKQTLNLNVTKQFDVIINREKRTTKQAQERLEMWASRAAEHLKGNAKKPSTEQGQRDRRGFGMDRGPEPSGGPGRGMKRGPGRGWGQADRIEQYKKQLEQKNKTIESWVKKKENIVNKRVETLLAGIEEFPW